MTKAHLCFLFYLLLYHPRRYYYHLWGVQVNPYTLNCMGLHPSLYTCVKLCAAPLKLHNNIIYIVCMCVCVCVLCMLKECFIYKWMHKISCHTKTDTTTTCNQQHTAYL